MNTTIKIKNQNISVYGLPTPKHPKNLTEEELVEFNKKYEPLLSHCTVAHKKKVMEHYSEWEKAMSLYNKYHYEKRKLLKEGKLSTPIIISKEDNTKDLKEYVAKSDFNNCITWICSYGSEIDMSDCSIEQLTKLTEVLSSMQEEAEVCLDCKLEEKEANEKKMAELKDLEAKYNAELLALKKQIEELSHAA